MHAYRTTDHPDADPTWYGTLREAGKDQKGAGPEFRVELIDVPTAKVDILEYLNGGNPSAINVLRTWKLGPRGGLVECPNPAVERPNGE